MLINPDSEPEAAKREGGPDGERMRDRVQGRGRGVCAESGTSRRERRGGWRSVEDGWTDR